tara:strand:+ start:45 stop:314 length:270 start_codon:yes stop_codon:yes gene_type:complete
MAYVYLLISKNSKKTFSYVGWTMDLKKRLKMHNNNTGAKFTKGRKWKLIYYESYLSKKEAMKREYILKKSYKLRKIIKENYLKGVNFEK